MPDLYLEGIAPGDDDGAQEMDTLGCGALDVPLRASGDLQQRECAAESG